MSAARRAVDPAPMSGVAAELLSTAARRAARRWHEDAAQRGAAAMDDVVSTVLSAVAHAVDKRRPAEVAALPPAADRGVGRHLVDMLQAELLQAWAEAPAAITPTDMLEMLHALEEIRYVVDRPERPAFEAPLSGPDGHELLVQVMHDLRSPLTSILFLAETLQRGRSGDVNELQRRQLGLIYSAGLGLSAVVSDALELARGGTELSDPEEAPFSCSEVLDSVAAIVRPMADEKGLEMRLHPPAVDRRVGHAGALTRALLNLTTNALKFTERGFVEIACRELPGERVEFSVRDSGPGINPEAVSNLFEPFRRAHGRSGYAFSGTGLGLAITRKLVDAQGGQLAYETAEGVGTRFFFTLSLPPHRPQIHPLTPR